MTIETKTNTKKQKKRIYQRFIKRPMDFLLSFCALIILSPLLLIVAILVKIKLGSPVIFKQPRPGLHEKIFTLYKFRTMTDKKDEKGELLPDSIRLTKFGKMLRSTSIDELPELINVLKGEMSIIGPRPLLIKYLPYYRENERKRNTVKPGITGLSQTKGRNILTWDERFKTDLIYVYNVSFLMDLQIMIDTILVVSQKKDILVGAEHVMQDLDKERNEETIRCT